jgi:hypothetical protein
MPKALWNASTASSVLPIIACTKPIAEYVEGFKGERTSACKEYTVFTFTDMF